MITNLAVLNEAQSYIDTPYHHLGRIKGHGIDCVGLIVCVCRALELPVIDCAWYPPMPLRDFFPNLDDFSSETREPAWGDLVLLATIPRNFKTPTHLGILSPRGFIHAENRVHKRVIDTAWSDSWKPRVVQFRRLNVAVEKETQWQQSF